MQYHMHQCQVPHASSLVKFMRIKLSVLVHFVHRKARRFCQPVIKLKYYPEMTQRLFLLRMKERMKISYRDISQEREPARKLLEGELQGLERDTSAVLNQTGWSL